MRPATKTSWLLDGELDWKTGYRDGVSVSRTGGIRLDASTDPQGPLGLLSADGSVGGLVLPKGMALDGNGILYLLGLKDAWIKRYHRLTSSFKLLPFTGGEGTDPRQFRNPANIAIAGSELLVADSGNGRVQVFSTRSLALIAILQVPHWRPQDIAVRGRMAYILDAAKGSVYRYRAGAGRMQPLFAVAGASERWSRILVDREGLLYLLDASTPRLEVFDDRGRKQFDATAAGDVRDRFPVPPLRLDHKDRFCLPAELTGACGLSNPERSTSPDATFVSCFPGRGAQIFARDGTPSRRTSDEPAGPRPYPAEWCLDQRGIGQRDCELSMAPC
jgi:hypothetical protein